MLFFAYCGFVFIASFVGYFLNADRYSRLAWLLFWVVPTGGVLALGWAALAAFIPAAFVGAMIFWRSPRSSFTGSDGLLRDEQIDGSRETLGLDRIASGLNVNPDTAEGRQEPDENAKSTPAPTLVTSQPSVVAPDTSLESESAFESLRRAKAEGRMACATLVLAEWDKATSREDKASPFPSGPEDDLLVRYMTERDIPVTRENYLSLAWPDGPPNPWTAELEAQLPERIRSSLPDADSDSDYVEMRCYTYRLEGCDPLLESERQFHSGQRDGCSPQPLTGDAKDSSPGTPLPKNVLRLPSGQKSPVGCATPFVKP